MKFFLALLVFAAAATGQGFARQNQTTPHSGSRAFALLPPGDCDGAPDLRQCIVAVPKDWSAADREIVADTLHRLTGNELVKGILVGAQENGYRGLRRFSTDTRYDAVRGPVPKFSPGFVLYNSKTIGLTDLFFDSSTVRDPLAGYRFGDLILLHELIHAFDDREISADYSFRAQTGWRFQNERWAFTNPVNFSEYNGVVAETLTLYAKGKVADAWTRDRLFATSMRVPLPTIQSLASPGESFADILAHLILDERARSYLRDDVVRWFEEHVFPTLRTNAERFTTLETAY